MSRERTRRDLIDRIIELESRIKALETATRIGATSIDSGALIINDGIIDVRDSNGNTLVSIVGGNQPAINLYPLGREVDPTNVAKIRSYWNGTGAPGSSGSIEISTTDATWRNKQIIATSTASGGTGLISISNEPYTASTDFNVQESLKAKMVIGNIGPDDRGIFLQGRWPNTHINRWQASFVDSFSVGPGFSNLLYTYGWTVPDRMIPIVTLTGATATSWAITSQDNNGFQVSWGDTTARGVNVWAVRTRA